MEGKTFLLFALLLCLGLACTRTSKTPVKKPVPEEEPYKRKEKKSKYQKHQLTTQPGWKNFFKSSATYLLVYATQGGTLKKSQEMAGKRRAEKVRQKWGIEIEAVADIHLDKKRAATHNLILTGPLPANQWLEELRSGLLIDLFANYGFEVKGQKYEGIFQGVAFYCPHPLNPKRQVLVFTGNSFRAAQAAFEKGHPHHDYTVVEGQEVIAKGNFPRK